MNIVVLAGGGGTRLWPMSDPARPKPFLPLLGDETLIQRTVARVRPLADPWSVTVVTDGRYAGLVREQLPEVRVVAEPVGRNTAAAIALAALSLEGSPDEVMVILPADHAIVSEQIFRDVLRSAADHLATGAFGIASPLVTLGIQHGGRPATEYGYLIPRTEMGTDAAGLRVYPLAAFEEKPTPERAAALITMPGVAWNAGIFLWRRRAILEAFERYAADILTTVRGGLERDALPSAYEEVRATSIDRAVMEPAAADGIVVMGAMNVGWSDLGSWTALLERLGSSGTGRIVQPGDGAVAGPDDLVIERLGSRLLVHDGPRDMLAAGPVAILEGVARDRGAVDDLIRRVTSVERTS